jgi:sugar phosphate isomerase/epimerase
MPKPLAVQLYTFRDPERFGGAGLGLDPGTLESIAAIGYLGVETVDVPGGDPVAARRALDDAGLAVTSSHTWSHPDDADAFARACDGVAALGGRRIIVSGSGFETVERVERFADDLRAAAEVAGERGLRLGYHNHSVELRPLDGVAPLDRLTSALDGAIDLQVDIFWVAVGGADPASVIARHAPRVVSLHLKDGVELPTDAASGEPFLNVPVGAGVVDPRPAIAAAEAQAGVEWLIVEFDHVAGSALEGVRRSHAFLTEHGLGRGRAT